MPWQIEGTVCICGSVLWCACVCVHMCLWKMYVHRSNCVCLHKSVGLDVDVHVFVQIHVGGCIIEL